MRALILAFLLTRTVFCTTASSAVTGWVEQRNVLAQGDVTPTFDGILFKNGPVNTFCYLLVGPYSKMYVGPRYAPARWSEVGFGLGVESTSRAMMKGGYVWLGHGRFSAVGVYEQGTSLFLKYEANCHVAGPLTVGW